MSTISPPTAQSGSQALRRPATERVLACAACQQRKIKCDRTFPCAHCVKRNIQCVPGTQLLRQRRRPRPQRELLDRLQKYEHLLRQNNVKFEPIGPSLNPTGEDDLSDGHDEFDDGRSHSGAVDQTAASPSSTPQTPLDTINLWRAITRESQESSNPTDSPIADGLRDRVRTAMEQISGEDQNIIGYRKTTVNLSTFHPSPADIFRLWQIYLDNINPLLKVTHTPTLQVRIIEAASNVENINPSFEALMFSIYSLCILSLEDGECQIMFHRPREELLRKYQFACQEALMNAKYALRLDRDTLTAMHLYLLSIRTDTNPGVLSAMLGVAIRISQRMGIHRESLLTKGNSPFEAEMRRRLWWSLMLFDARTSERSDHKDPPLAPTWDCGIPTNVDDFYLRPQMEQLPPSQTTPTEALFVVVWAELSDFIRNTSSYLDFTNPALKPLARELPDGGSLISFEKRIEEKYLNHCDPTIPIHYMTIWVARAYLAKCRLWEHYAKYYDLSIHQSDAERDKALLLACRAIDCDTKLASSPLTKGFTWYLHSYFPFPAYMHIVQELGRRPLCDLAQRGWETMNSNFDVRVARQKPRSRPIFHMFSKHIQQAWEALQAVSDPTNPPDTPQIILSIRKREAEIERLRKETEMQDQAGQTLNTETVSTQMPMSMGFSNPNHLFEAAHQPGFGGTDDFMFPGMLGQLPPTFDSGQFNWPPMDWGLGS